MTRFPGISGVYCCECGVETPCEVEDLRLGQVFECPACKLVCGHVYPKSGGRAWVKIQPQEVEFYDLLGKRVEDEE